MEGHERLSRLFSGNLPAMFLIAFKRSLLLLCVFFASYAIFLLVKSLYDAFDFVLKNGKS